MRFETQQKSKKRAFIQNDIKDIFLSLFHEALVTDPKTYLTLKIQDIRDERKQYLERIDKLSVEEADRYEFPKKHL